MTKRFWLLSLVAFSGACDCAGGDGNGIPTALDASFETPEDTARNFTFQAVDPDGTALTYTISTPSHGTVTGTAPSLTYTPAPDYAGEDSFEVTVSDGTIAVTATVSVTVTPVNDAPLATDDTADADEDTDVVIAAADLLANDDDVDSATLTVTEVSGAMNGTVSLSGTDVTFSPTAGFHGIASFTYTISDGALTDTGVVTVSVGNVNDAPVAVADALSTDEDVQLDIAGATLTANDTDIDGDALGVVSVQDAVGGTVSLDAGVASFVPTANTNGEASFTYTMSDGVLTSTATVTVTVNAVNDAPVAVDDTATTDEDVALWLEAATLLANDTDVDGPSMQIVAVDQAANGTVALDANGITFTPAANYEGSASFRYTVSDGTDTATATVQLTILPVNDAPVAVGLTTNTPEDVPLVLATADLVALASDVDGPTLTVASVGSAIHGTVSLDGANVTFVPFANFVGVASFSFLVSDGTLSSSAVATIDVTTVNDPPVAVADTATGGSDQPLLLTGANLVANDTDIDGPGGLVVVGAAGAMNGSVSVNNGDVTFEPASGFVGVASFTYTVSDGVDTATGVVTLTIEQSNRAPVATNQAIDLRRDTPITITLSATDADGNPLSYAIVASPTQGTLSGSGAVYTYTPTTGYTGTDSFTFVANDGQVDSNVATISLTIADPVCGDSVTEATELCDDGNTTAGDGCRADCRGVEICGDGIVDAIVGEQCDDGNLVAGDGCTPSCQLPPFTNIAPVLISGSLSCNTNNSNAGRKAAVDALGRLYVTMLCGGEAYVNVSTDRGVTWPGPISTGITGATIVAVEGGPTGIAYVVARTSSSTILFTRTLDAGLTWETPRTLATGVTDSEVSIDALADEVYIAVRSGTGLAVLRNVSRGAGAFATTSLAMVNTFHEVIIDRISGNVILGSDNPAFRVRISDDQAATFGAESTPAGSAFYSDWAGSNGFLYVTGTNGDNNIDRIPLSSPGTSTQVTGLPSNISANALRAIDADAVGNAYVVSQLSTGVVQLDRMVFGAATIAGTDARTIAAAGTFPAVAALPSNNGALVAYTTGTSVYAAVVVY